MSEKKLSLKTKAGFGVCDLGGNLFFTAMGFWSLNFLTDTVGISAALAGMAVMIAKLWDAVTDPMMGYISDRTRSRWGRRRPYLLFGALPLFAAMWFFFTKPGFVSPVALTAWATLALMFLNTAYTVVNIPYSALTPELTDDYHERTSLNGYRFGFAVVGTILGAAAVQPIVSAFPTQAKGFSAVGCILGAVMAVTALITYFTVKEKNSADTPKPTDGFFATYLQVFKTGPYVILLLTYALNITGINFLSGMIVYYFKYIYQQEGMATPAMVILLLVAMASIPVSVLISKHIGKKRVYQISLFILASSCAIIFFLGHILGIKFFLAVMVYAGVGIGFGYVPPFSMVPDTVEYDALKTGKRKEGAFYGMWTFTSKVGQALAIMISGGVLALGGYVADAIQGPAAQLAIRLLVGPIPALVLIGAIVLIQLYPLDEKTYNAIVEAEHKAASDAAGSR